MIGQTAWFSRRKYGGWGLAPKSWQGYVYILAVAGLIFGVQAVLPESFKTISMLILSGIFALDVIHIMLTLPKDELENRIEAIAERNAAWGMIVVIAIALAFQTAQSVALKTNLVDPFMIVVLIVGVILKGASNFWLEKKGI